MSWKKYFFDDVSEESPVAAGQAVTPQSGAIPAAAPVMQSSVSGGTEIDERLLDTIEQKIKDANLPGPDYIELKEAAENKDLIAAEPDEEKRWKQAFLFMKIHNAQAGVTKKRILSAIDHYVGIVRNEISVGLQELNELRDQNITKEQSSVKSLEAEISKLEKQLEEKKRQKAEKEAKIEESRSKYAHQEEVFNRTTSFVLNMLEGDKQKIEKYINEN